jgi:hypothetical protein
MPNPFTDIWEFLIGATGDHMTLGARLYFWAAPFDRR